MSPFFRIEEIDHIAVVHLDRPPANAMDLPFARALDAGWSELERRDDLRAAVVTGAGTCFSAGLDLKTVPAYGPDEQRAMIDALNKLFGKLYATRLPTVAAVNGHAIAGGMVLVLALDYRVAAEGSYQIGLAEARAGISFPLVPLAIVRNELDPSVRRALALSARNIDPGDALARGVFDELVPPERLLARALERARDLASIPPLTYARVKRQLRGDAIAEIERVNATGADPMLQAGLGPEASQASARLLGKHSPT